MERSQLHVGVRWGGFFSCETLSCGCSDSVSHCSPGLRFQQVTQVYHPCSLPNDSAQPLPGARSIPSLQSLQANNDDLTHPSCLQCRSSVKVSVLLMKPRVREKTVPSAAFWPDINTIHSKKSNRGKRLPPPATGERPPPIIHEALLQTRKTNKYPDGKMGKEQCPR